MSNAIHSATYDVAEPRLMTIESCFAKGFAGLQMIGYTSEVCRDGKERAKAALEALNITLPPQRLMLSLRPADVRKDGSQFDLPIAVSLALLISGQPRKIDASKFLFSAELSLTGELIPVKGCVSFALSALEYGLSGIVVAKENLAELKALASLKVHGSNAFQIIAAKNLKDVLDWIAEGKEPDLRFTPIHAKRPEQITRKKTMSFDDMILDPQLVQLASIIAVGKHNVLLRGEPGSGKSMFAQRLSSILSPMNDEEHLHALKLASFLYSHIPQALITGRPPFRSPHHQASASAILGSREKPGEVSLAHGGVLFLDEFPEFRRDIIEGLREPLETGDITVSRSKSKITWKSKFILVAACNNCPCGWYGSHRRRCLCSQNQVRAYNHRLSGPILDRIDLHHEMTPPTQSELMRVSTKRESAEGQTAKMRAWVDSAQKKSFERNQKFGFRFNSEIPGDLLYEVCGLEEEKLPTLLANFPLDSMTKRGIVKCIRVARTIADLEGSRVVTQPHLDQALSWQPEYRSEQRGDRFVGLG